MSHFHLSAELPGGDENHEERVKIMAEGFEKALIYGATNPDIRLRMLMGEANARWLALLHWLKGELARESPEVRELAKRVMAGEAQMFEAQLSRLLSIAMEPEQEPKPEPDV